MAMYEATATLSLHGCSLTWLFEKLKEQQKSGLLCDAHIVVHGMTFPVHRAVLSAYSQYFEKMFLGHFQECQAEKVDLTHIFGSREGWQALLEYFYSSNLVITEDTLEDILNGGSHFLIDDVRDRCAYYMIINTGFHNATRMWALADMYNLQEVAALCKILVCGRFHDLIIDQVETLQVPAAFLKKITTEGAFSAVPASHCADFLVRWVNHDSDQRLAKLRGLIKGSLISNALGCPEKSWEFESDKDILQWLGSFTLNPLPSGSYTNVVLALSDISRTIQLHAYIPDQKRWVVFGGMKRSGNTSANFQILVGLCNKKVVISAPFSLNPHNMYNVFARNDSIVMIDFEKQSMTQIPNPHRPNVVFSSVKHFCFDGELFCLLDERVAVTRHTQRRRKSKESAASVAPSPNTYQYVRQLLIWNEEKMAWKLCSDLPLPAKSSQQLQGFYTVECRGDVYVWCYQYQEWDYPKTAPFFLIIRKRGTKYRMSRLAAPPIDSTDSMCQVEMAVGENGCILVWKMVPHWSLSGEKVFQMRYDPGDDTWDVFWSHSLALPRNELSNVCTKPYHHHRRANTIKSTYLALSNVTDLYLVDSSYKMLPTFSHYDNQEDQWCRLPAPPVAPIIDLVTCRVPSDLLADRPTALYKDNSQETGTSPFYDVARKHRKGWFVASGTNSPNHDEYSSYTSESTNWDDCDSSSGSYSSDQFLVF